MPIHFLNAERISRDVVVIGASAGGIEAVRLVLGGLSANIPAVIGIVIHRASRPSASWEELLGSRATVRVVEPLDGERLEVGTAYIAPPDTHMIFDVHHARLSQGPKEHFTRPAVNPLFESAAKSFGPRVLAVVLTGAGSDGVAGLRAVSASGGLSLVQAPFEAAHESMPRNAIAGDHPNAVMRLEDIVASIDRLARGLPVALDFSPIEP